MAGSERAREDLVSRRSSLRAFWACLPLPFLAAAYVAGRAQGGSWSPFDPAMVDLQAIIGAAQRLLEGSPLYGVDGTPFSMPPVVALLAVPLAVLGVDAAEVLWVLLTAALVCQGLIRPVLGRLGTGFGPTSPWVPLVGALVIALAAPVKDNFSLGQVTVIVACLLLADASVPVTRLGLPRGVLTGIAAAVAIFPAAVILTWLCVPRSRRAGLVALFTAAALTLITWLLAPASSARYFAAALTGGHLAEDNALDRSSNGSLAAIVHRVTDGESATVLTIVLVAVVVGAAVLAGWALASEGHQLLAMLTAALGGVAAMPLAFPHAWVLAIVLAAVVVTGRYRPGWQLCAAVLGVWTVVMPVNRVSGSELVAAGTAIGVIAWLCVVSFGLRRRPVSAR